MKKNILKFGLIATLSTLTACSVPTSNLGQNHRTEVSMVRLPHMMAFPQNIGKLSAIETTKLHRFLALNKVGYGDEISLDFPLNKNGVLSGLNQNRIKYLVKFFQTQGLDLNTSLTPYGTTPAAGQGRLLITRYIAKPPTCGNYSDTVGHDNAAFTDLGCTLQAHLGMMVANPRDLIHPESSTTTGTDKAVNAITRYKKAVSTVSTQSTTGTGSSN